MTSAPSSSDLLQLAHDAGPFRVAMRQLSPLQLWHLQQEQPPFFHALAKTGSAAAILLCLHEFHFALEVGHQSYGDIGFPIHAACSHRNLEVLKLLVTYPTEAHIFDFTRDSKRSLLHIAAFQNEEEPHAVETFQLILGIFASSASELINAVDSFGRTALHTAAEKGNANFVKALVSAGANVRVLNKLLQPAWATAIEHHQGEVRRSLLQSLYFFSDEKNQPVFLSPSQFCINSKLISDEETVEVVETLRELGDNMKVTMPTGLTLVHLAERRGKHETKKFLENLIGKQLPPPPPFEMRPRSAKGESGHHAAETFSTRL